MNNKDNTVITFRLANTMIDRIDDEVKCSEVFHTRTQLIKSAIIHYLNHLDKERARGGGLNKSNGVLNNFTNLPIAVFPAVSPPC